MRSWRLGTLVLWALACLSLALGCARKSGGAGQAAGGDAYETLSLLVALTGLFRDKALARGGIRQLFSDYELYGSFTAGSFVFKTQFIERHPKTVRRFVEGVAKAIEWARSHPREEVVQRMTAIVVRRKRNETADAVQFWKSTGIAGPGGSLRPRELQLWLDWLIKDGTLRPDQVALDAAYSNTFNPYAESS